MPVKLCDFTVEEEFQPLRCFCECWCFRQQSRGGVSIWGFCRNPQCWPCHRTEFQGVWAWMPVLPIRWCCWIWLGPCFEILQKKRKAKWKPNCLHFQFYGETPSWVPGKQSMSGCIFTGVLDTQTIARPPWWKQYSASNLTNSLKSRCSCPCFLVDLHT